MQRAIGADGVRKAAAVCNGMAAAKATVAKAVVVPASETRNVSFVTRRRIASPWVSLLDRVGDLRAGEALRLDMPKVPASLMKAAKVNTIKLEFSECGDYVLIREKGMGAPE